MLKEHKFKHVQGDFDETIITQRIITGKFTKKRRKAIEHAVRFFNQENSAPYGLSPRGYAYTCGCEHDCCGHLTRKSADVTFDNWGRHHVAVIKIYASYNY